MPMIDRLFTGGRSGVESGVRQAARRLDRPVDDRGSPMANLRAAEGMLILLDGPDGSAFDLLSGRAGSLARPVLTVDLHRGGFHLAREIAEWAEEHRIQRLYVTGGDTPASETATADVLEAAFNMMLTSAAMPGALTPAGGGEIRSPVSLPRTVAEAADDLISRLTFREKTRIANMTDDQLASLVPSLGRYIMNELRLPNGNTELLAACRAGGADDRDPGTATRVILVAVREKLQGGAALRVIR